MSGYTRVPNDFLDDLAPTLSEAELRLLLAIFRQTLGWQRNAVALSLTALQRATGLTNRTHMVRALRLLEDKNLIRTRPQFTADGRPSATLYQVVPAGYLVPVGYSVPEPGPDPVPAAYPLIKKELKKEVSAEDRQAWEATVVRLRGMMSAPNYETYVAGLALVAASPTALTLRAPSAYVGGVVRAKWLPWIQKAWGQTVKITVVDRLSEQESAG